MKVNIKSIIKEKVKTNTRRENMELKGTFLMSKKFDVPKLKVCLIRFFFKFV